MYVVEFLYSHIGEEDVLGYLLAIGVNHIPVLLYMTVHDRAFACMRGRARQHIRCHGNIYEVATFHQFGNVDRISQTSFI